MKIIFVALLVFCLAILVQGEGKVGCIKSHADELKAIRVKTSAAWKECKDVKCKTDAVINAIKEAQVILKECLKGTGAE